MAKYLRISLNPSSWFTNQFVEFYKKNYENWKKEAKKFMDNIRNEKKTYEEFNKWLDKNK